MKPIDQKKLYDLNTEFLELIDLYKSKKLPSKILLSGLKGTGKCTLAYHLINYILSLNEDYHYNLDHFEINDMSKTYQLINNGSNPNFTLIDVDADKKSIDISQIRELISNLNKSSFNDQPRFVLIDNIEYLNKNSINALLKILEEPNKDVNFILIHNNKNILPTLKSRCLNFRISLQSSRSYKIASKLIGQNIFDLINEDLIDYYSTPGDIFNLYLFAKEHEIDLKNINLKSFIDIIIKKQYYKKETSIKYLTYNFVELFLRNNLSKNTFVLINKFLKKIDKIKRFNLDEEAFFIELESQFINE